MKPSASAAPAATSRSFDRLVFFVLAAMLLFAPLLRGGNRQIALTVLLALGLVLLALLLSKFSFQALPLVQAQAGAPSRPRIGGPRWFWLAVGVLVSSPAWVGLLYLVPIDSGTWSSLPGREPYLPSLQAAGLKAADVLPLSLAPSATWASMWAGVPVAAAFLAALVIPASSIQRLLFVLLAVGAVQVLVSVGQFAQGPDSPLYFDTLFPGQRFIGTFNNRNHLADLMAMLIPVWFYFLVAQGQQGERGEGSSRRGPLSTAGKPMWMLFGFSMVVVILSAQSRGGLIAGSVVLVLSGLLYLASLRRHMTGWQQVGVLALLLVFGLVALASVGIEGLASRLEREVLSRDAAFREAMALATFDAARQFWPWGSGLGSFEVVFPRFQGIDTTGHASHAHNDYAQLAMELGAVGIALGCLLLLMLLRQSVLLIMAARRGGRMSDGIAVRGFCGLGLLAILMHSWAEFNIHIPALAITAASLAGIFLRPLERGSPAQRQA